MAISRFPELGERVSLEGMVSRDEFWQFKKEMQEETARRESADKLRDDFAKGRRWYIGIIIALVGVGGGLLGGLISCAA